jgi:hypothetical protein
MQSPNGSVLAREAANGSTFASILDGLDPVAAAAWNNRIVNHAQHHAQTMPASHFGRRSVSITQSCVLKAIPAGAARQMARSSHVKHRRQREKKQPLL